MFQPWSSGWVPSSGAYVQNVSPTAASANLRKAVHFARRALGSPTAIATGSDQIGLWPGEDVIVDAVAFESSARNALERRDRDLAVTAASLYVGELLPEDRYAHWVLEPRERLRLLAQGVFKQALLWERVLEVEPADEEAHRAMMERALASGDRIGAIRQFERLRQRLRIDIGLGPDEASVALYERAIDGGGAGHPSVVERVWALLAWGIVHAKSGDLGRARDKGEQARGLAIDTGLGRPEEFPAFTNFWVIEPTADDPLTIMVKSNPSKPNVASSGCATVGPTVSYRRRRSGSLSVS